MLDSALFLTLIVILVTAVLGAIIAMRQRDPCLRQWDGYPITLRLRSGEERRGRLKVFGTGLELLVEERAASGDRFSHILYKQEFDQIDALLRFTHALTPEQRRARERALRHAYRPGLLRRWARALRNWGNTLKDAVGDALAMVVVRAQPTGAGSADSSKRLRTAGVAALGGGGHAYDPLLERHIGRRVVVAVDGGDASREYVGVFREYSGQFLSIVDVEAPDGEADQADLILPRAYAALRHAAEPRVDDVWRPARRGWGWRRGH